MGAEGMGMKTVVPALLSLLLACAFVEAQETVAADTLTPRRMLINISRGADDAFTANDALQLSRSLQIKILAATSEITIVEPAAPLTDVSPAGLKAAAGAVGADSWLSVIADGGWASLSLSVRSADLVSDATVLDITVKRSAWGSPQDLATEEWAEIVQPLAGHYHRLPVTVTRTIAPATLTVKALPGTRITGLGDAVVVVDDSGTASAELPAQHQYVLGASRPGYFYASQQVFLSTDKLITLVQAPESAWSIDASFQDRAYPGLSLGWSPVPGRVTLKLGIRTYLFGLAFGSDSLFVSSPLSDLFFAGTVSPIAELGAFRPYLGLEGFLRIEHRAGRTPSLEGLSPGGVKAVAGIELVVTPGGGFYLEYAPIMYFTQTPELLKAALGSGSVPPGWVFASASALNMLSFRAGYRWQL
jgi:hypothetical protein